MPLNSEYRVATRFEHQAGGPAAWCIRNYRVTATNGNDSFADLAMTWIDQLNAGMLRMLPTSVDIPEVVVGLSATPSTPGAVIPWGLSGLYSTAKFFPIQVAGIIRLSYVGMDPRHPGKWFQPYLPMWPDNSEYLQWQNDFDAWKLLLAVDLVSAGDPAVTYSPVVWHRSSSTSSLVDAALGSDPRFYTQRRRAKDLSERTLFVDCVGPL